MTDHGFYVLCLLCFFHIVNIKRVFKFCIYILNLNTYLHAWFHYVPNIINAKKYPKNPLKRLKLFSSSQTKGLRRRRRGPRASGLGPRAIAREIVEPWMLCLLCLFHVEDIKLGLRNSVFTFSTSVSTCMHGFILFRILLMPKNTLKIL